MGMYMLSLLRRRLALLLVVMSIRLILLPTASLLLIILVMLLFSCPTICPFPPLSWWMIGMCSLDLALAVVRSLAMGCWWGLSAPQIPWLLLTHSLPAIIGWIELARVLVLLLEELVRLDIRPMIALEPLAKHELRRG
jgi:hypothetical protein